MTITLSWPLVVSITTTALAFWWFGWVLVKFRGTVVGELTLVPAFLFCTFVAALAWTLYLK